MFIINYNTSNIISYYIYFLRIVSKENNVHKFAFCRTVRVSVCVYVLACVDMCVNACARAYVFSPNTLQHK